MLLLLTTFAFVAIIKSLCNALLLFFVIVVLNFIAVALNFAVVVAFTSSALFWIGVALCVPYQCLRATLIAFRELQECGDYVNRQDGV